MSENKNSQNQNLESLRVYISLMDQSQQEFRAQQKEIEGLWNEILQLSLLSLERQLDGDEDARLSRVRRQYQRMAGKQARKLEEIEMVMKSHESQFSLLSDFRDPEMQEEIFQVLCQRFLLESTRIFGNHLIAKRFIKQTFFQES